MTTTALTFIVKSVDAVDAGALVVSTQHEEILWVLDLVCKQQTYRLQGLFAAVDVVAQEQVVTLGRKAAILKQSQQVVILTMDVT